MAEWAEWADWMLVAAALAAATVTLIPRSGRQGARMVQAMGFLLLSVIVSLMWLRLGSIDVALAEAALGGGLLGAVLVFIAAAPRRAGRTAGTQPPLRAERGSGVVPHRGVLRGAPPGVLGLRRQRHR